MRKISLVIGLSVISFLALAQTKPAVSQSKTTSKPAYDRPKLVVGIVVDQMRWDYLYRYYDRYAANGAFKKFLNQGFSCENTIIPYTPTITACGHTCVYTGSVPAIHGITGNAWWDRDARRSVYCSEDKSVKTVGAPGTSGEMSPRNMLSTSIADELKFATNFRGKVIGVAIKDRGAILPAGHAADAAYWYDGRSGNFVTSTYYMDTLPGWVTRFNQRKLMNGYYEKGWNTLYPINTYVQSTADDKPYESKPFGADQKGFPYDLKKFVDKSFGTVSSTPYGNTLTIEMAKAAIENEKLGADAITDMLCVSFSSPDYIGHSFGPNSIEAEDNYLRLDKEMGEFFTYLDAKVGKGQYLVFLSADHGVAPVPGFSKENKLPGGTIPDDRWAKELSEGLKSAFGSEKLIISNYNYQVHLDHHLLDSLKLDIDVVKKYIIRYFDKQPEISRVFDLAQVGATTLNDKIKSKVSNGYYPKRGGDIQLILQPGYIDGGATGTTHGSPYSYDAHVPMLFYGWKIKPGKINRETYMTDIAPTVAALLKIEPPSGNVGEAVEEVLK
ncbi:MAG: alkaline phosphatase family protein [Chitinophagaceae bacterium]|nr:MAG: alkaline phosphatase family protein [Chitinophagaceae bacterium]